MKILNWSSWIKTLFIGKARSLSDEKIFHKISLIAVFAWIGLGADGLSSSCYGPEEAFKALGAHPALVTLIAIACIVTIAVICTSYSQIIELFPSGGGGYLVASKLLSPVIGVVSGCALLVDYVLTIAISIASGADALFSILPSVYQVGKFPVAIFGVVFLICMNLRGVRESVLVWAPVFFLFVGTHAFAILFAFSTHVWEVPVIVVNTVKDMHVACSELGWFGVLLLLVRSYSVGAGTYTGIEAVSNGLPILREPRVATGKRTMLYMGFSLGLTVGGLLLAYLLYHVIPQEGKTLNAVLFEKITESWPGSLSKIFVSVAMISASSLLFVAAQAGFLDGPRVLSSMALDRWFPSRFASLSDRFVTQNGVLMMGIAALIVLLMTRGSVGLLVVLYSINVFITFTISQLGMVRHWWSNRTQVSTWRRKLIINSVGFCLTTFILISLCTVKFWSGGWVTLLATGLLVGVAFLIRRHYRLTTRQLSRLEELQRQFDDDSCRKPMPVTPPVCDPMAKTAVILVNGYNGLGVHTLLAIIRMFPGVFRNFVFLHVGVIDAGNFKGADEITRLRLHIEQDARKYADHMKRRGYYAESVTEIGTDIIESAGELGMRVLKQFPHAVFFGGQLVFANESLVTRLLHNFVVFALQRKFFRQGAPFLIVPIRV
ncbi:MAG: APC family permease [Kiritimatiellae bacterium]|nr:APC family permease [Kiritimatiellia bacterium]MDD5519431.1 APC family permease [Kiritimatiellia bacterium]